MHRPASILVLLTALCTVPAVVLAAPVRRDTTGTPVLGSPDENIALTFDLKEGVPFYSVAYKGRAVIAPSALGCELTEGSLTSHFVIVETRESAKDETWEQVWGEQRQVRNHYNQLTVALQQTNQTRRTLRVVFRAFDHAIAFRYEWPEQPSLAAFQILDERTEFVLADDPMALWQPALRPQQAEQLYAHTRLSELWRQAQLKQGDESFGDNPRREPIKAVTTPLTLETEGGLYLVIHEADLTDYAGMQLQPVDRHTLKCYLTPWSDGVRVKASTPFVSPWRMVMISDRLSDIVEQTSVTARNLNPPCRIADTSWIQPCKYVGIWWGMHLGKYTWHRSRPGEDSTDGLGATTRNTRDYIDFAAEHGFKGVLVEGWNKGWARDWVAHADEFSFTEPNPEYDLEGLAAYAHAKGVDLISHHETGAIIENYERQVEAAFAQCQRLGIHHVKSGYVGMEPRVVRRDSAGREIGREYLDGQYMVRHYRRIAELAARYQIMLDVHEPIKDTGESRTWPNFMTREGARGQEFNAWAGDGGNPPNHDVNLVFTRFLSGPMDFTPGVLQVTYPEYRKNNRVNTTVAKQLALYVTFYSPLQMAADLPEHYAKYPDLLRFIEKVPTDWEETRMLNGEIGEYVTLARRARGGEEWFIGAITNEKARQLRVPLGFLPENMRYVAEMYRDGTGAHWQTNPFAHEIEKELVDRNTELRMRLAPGGGEAVRLRPASAAELLAFGEPQ